MNYKFYICNRKKCMECNPECTHTRDINYAVNFRKEPYGKSSYIWVENEKKEEIKK